MKNMTPVRDLTAAARAGLSGNWGESIGVTLVYILLSIGTGKVPKVGWLLQLIFSAPLVVGVTVYPKKGNGRIHRAPLIGRCEV